MITKKIALIAMMGSILQPIVAQEAQQQLCKKEIAIKIAKITGYSLEALLAGSLGFTLKDYLLMVFKKSIKKFKNTAKYAHVNGATLSLVLMFGHSLKGLTTELTPVVKIAIQRIKKEKPTHQVGALFNKLKRTIQA